jgi:hypothetical protein
MRPNSDELVQQATHAWAGGLSWMLWISLGIAAVLIAFFIWDYYRDYCRRREFERHFGPKRPDQEF